MIRGYFGIGIYHGKTEVNAGTLWRGAWLYGASFIFTIGRRYRPQSSDTQKTWRHIPMLNFLNYEAFREFIPFDCQIIGVEQGGAPLNKFQHPDRAIYLLGAEDHGIPPNVLAAMKHVVSVESARPQSLNVAVAGSLVMYDRYIKVGLG